MPPRSNLLPGETDQTSLKTSGVSLDRSMSRAEWSSENQLFSRSACSCLHPESVYKVELVNYVGNDKLVLMQ